MRVVVEDVEDMLWQLVALTATAVVVHYHYWGFAVWFGGFFISQAVRGGR